MSTIVLGAGYAGVLAANRLSGRGEPVTLVTPHSWFVERIRLHAVAAGARPDARRDLSSLLHPGVKVVTDAATRIDFDVVHLASEGELPYQTLVCAVGSGAPGDAVFFHALTLHASQGAKGLRRVISIRFLGDDAQRVSRPWRCSPPIPADASFPLLLGG